MSEVQTSFFAVYHTCPLGKAEEWWRNASRLDFSKLTKTQHDDGLFCHYFLPVDVAGPILSVWECQDRVSVDAFKVMFDEVEWPCSGEGLTSHVYEMLPGAALPPSAFPNMPALDVQSTGSFFWSILGATDRFWAAMSEFDSDRFHTYNRRNGVRNHCFIPTGTGAQDPIFCVWETRRPMSVNEFEAFLLPGGPVPGAFLNGVQAHLPGAALPVPAFRKRSSFMLSAAMPFMDEMMGSMREELTPPRLDLMQQPTSLVLRQMPKRALTEEEAAELAATEELMNNIQEALPLKLPKKTYIKTRKLGSKIHNVKVEMMDQMPDQ